MRIKKIKIKLYSLEYIIEMADNNLLIYPEIYQQIKSKYFLFDAVMSYFTVYNEPENIDRINIIE
ncbi:MAG: hypothetical protein U0M05_04890 [Clostridia bacterium]|jgi:hypothetical protein|nr:hypothetical protein [Clostridia bacterium]HJJ09791.1 hypothetical protein [Clostridiaceae bacterium]